MTGAHRGVGRGCWIRRPRHKLTRTSRVTVADLKWQARNEAGPSAPILLGVRECRIPLYGEVMLPVVPDFQPFSDAVKKALADIDDDSPPTAPIISGPACTHRAALVGEFGAVADAGHDQPRDDT